MIVDESMLRAYVDGELDVSARERLEAVLANSAPLREQVQALRASCLPYRAAFEVQALPDVPARLARDVQSLVAVAGASAASGERGSMQPRRDGRRQRRAVVGMGLAAAASFAAGLLVPWRPSALGVGVGQAQDARDATARAAQEPWVGAIASYHALYVRETLDSRADAPSRLAQLSAGFSDKQRAALVVPDLTSQGLAFKRVQRLGFGDKPLLQMVYLPAQGRPAALCLLPVEQPDAAPVVRVMEGLDVASWTKDGVAYVLVSDMGRDRTVTMAQALVEGRFAAAG